MKNKRWLWTGILAIAFCWAVTALVFHFVEAEPMNAGQILTKSDWTAEEMVRGLSSARLESESIEKRQQVAEHMRKQLQKLPTDKRKAVIRQIMASRFQRFRQHWKHLSIQERDEMVEKRLDEMKERNRDLSTEERERIKQRLQSPEGQEFLNSVMGKFHEELSADERASLSPLVREWLAQLEAL